MFASNQRFRITGDTYDNLKTALRAALSIGEYDGQVTAYHLSEDNGLVFGWVKESKHGWTVLPAPADVNYMLVVAENYLKGPMAHTTYAKMAAVESFGDGDAEKGWEVYHPEDSFKDLDLSYAVIAIRPQWTYYAK